MIQSIKSKQEITELDQLKISSQAIQFTLSSQSVRSITLKNIHQIDALAYKIKTNNLQAVEVTPNYGLIKANTSLSLRVKVTQEDFDAKLLINYFNAGQKPGEFEDVWNANENKKIKSKTLRVYRLSAKELENNIQQNETKKNQHIIRTTTKRSFSQDRTKQSKYLKQSFQLNENSFVNNITQLQQKLLQQQTANLKLKQQLQITQQKLKIINQERLQIKINKSIGIICQDYHTSFTALLLYGLAAFVFGYVLAKWEKL